MGLGDLTLSALRGLHLGFLGWAELATGALTAFLLGGLVAAALILTGHRTATIPFGPFTLARAWIGICTSTALTTAPP